jgi:hypothetical protein
VTRRGSLGLAIEDECVAMAVDEGSQMLKRMKRMKRMKNSSVRSVATHKGRRAESRCDRS